MIIIKIQYTTLQLWLNKPSSVRIQSFCFSFEPCIVLIHDHQGMIRAMHSFSVIFMLLSIITFICGLYSIHDHRYTYKRLTGMIYILTGNQTKASTEICRLKEFVLKWFIFSCIIGGLYWSVEYNISSFKCSFAGHLSCRNNLQFWSMLHHRLVNLRSVSLFFVCVLRLQ